MNFQNRLRDAVQPYKADLLKSVIFTYIWGLAAHGYMFLNNSISHDSLSEFILTTGPSSTASWKISLGRFMVPIYEYVFRGFFTHPWLIGVLSLLYISLAVFLVCRLFDIRSGGMMCLVSGIFTVNTTLISLTAVFIHDLDCDAMALLLAVFAVFLWKRYKFGYLLGTVPLALSLGIYQSYISTAITLIMMLCILTLLNGGTFKAVFVQGLRSIGMLIGGGLLYLVLMKAAIALADISLATGSYNSVDSMMFLSFGDILHQIAETWEVTLRTMLKPASVYPQIAVKLAHAFLFGSTALAVIVGICRKKMPIPEKLLTVALCLLMPLGMNVARILTGGMSHDVMHYALWLSYLFYLLIGRWMEEKWKFPSLMLRQLVRGVSVLMIAVLLWGNVRLANKAYLIKDFEQDAMLSFFTRVTARIETHEDYDPYTTKVMFVGKPEHIISQVNDSDDAYSLTGMWYSYPWYSGYDFYYYYYYRYVLLNSMAFADESHAQVLKEDQRVQEMPAFPHKDSISIVDDTLVVKLGPN